MNTHRRAAAILTYVAAVQAALLVAWRRLVRLGFGRHGALAGARRAFPALQARAQTPVRRALSLFAGSFCIGIGVTLLQQARLGLTPYDVLVSGLMPRLGLSFGQTVWLISAVLFGIAAVLGSYPSRWGVAFVFANGVAIDAVSSFINAPSGIAARWFFVALALLAICAGISLVVHSGSTGGAFELLMAAGEARGLDRKAVRTSLEVGVLTLGIALGGAFGPATVAVALGVGPLLALLSQALVDHAHGRADRRVRSDTVSHSS